MALFQILRGKAANLAGKAFHDGYAYLTPDDGAFYIDAETDGKQKRIHINPKPDLQELTADEVQSAWDSYPPPPSCFLTFSSPSAFSIDAGDPSWDGVMKYSTDTIKWFTWDGSEISAVDAGGEYKLYLAGTSNTIVTGGTSSQKKWTLTGSNIACSGNIESLLDHATVAAGNHPTMGNNCYSHMFNNCTGLIMAPELPSVTLSANCYAGIFQGCTSLTTAPALPATTLAGNCYQSMFADCTNLAVAPELPAVTLADYCYDGMFKGCTGLTSAPALPATTLAGNCYYCMFYGCTGLTSAPELPATTLATDCYGGMFYGCIALSAAPALPAMALANDCYSCMFYGCTTLATAPALPATTLANSCYSDMFNGCTSLTTAPALPATALDVACYAGMFKGCISLTAIPELQATTLPLICYQFMFENCTNIKLSSTQTGNYTLAYRIPTSGTSTRYDGDSLNDMFAGTGGTFTGTPKINTTYYLETSNTIV